MFEKHNIFTLSSVTLSILNNVFGFILLLLVTTQTAFSDFNSYFLVIFIALVFLLNTYLNYQIVHRSQRALIYLAIFYAVQILTIESQFFSMTIVYGLSIPVSWSLDSAILDINLTGLVISALALISYLTVRRSNKPLKQPDAVYGAA